MDWQDPNQHHWPRGLAREFVGEAGERVGAPSLSLLGKMNNQIFIFNFLRREGQNCLHPFTALPIHEGWPMAHPRSRVRTTERAGRCLAQWPKCPKYFYPDELFRSEYSIR